MEAGFEVMPQTLPGQNSTVVDDDSESDRILPRCWRSRRRGDASIVADAAFATRTCKLTLFNYDMVCLFECRPTVFTSTNSAGSISTSIRTAADDVRITELPVDRLGPIDKIDLAVGSGVGLPPHVVGEVGIISRGDRPLDRIGRHFVLII